ncbi:MAG TPA: sigma-70 factor domain-containing protein, partial [Solirubrobacteraceae bacterium]|nr:sigma-70 factor domain-containing protein [Solirubrobacteraceae bacterium]
MSVGEVEQLEEVIALIAQGRRFGVLSADQVESAIGDLGLDEVERGELGRLLVSRQIAVADDPAQDGDELGEPPAVAGRPGPGGPAAGRSSVGPEMPADSLQLFLRDLGRVRLLTAGEEIVLAKRIERGDVRAKQQMVEANLRLVISVAKH